MDGLITNILLAAAAPNSPAQMAASWSSGLAVPAAAIACAAIIFGASYGLATIGGKAVEAIARQPEAGGRIFLMAVIAAAMVEGFTFFALLVCFLTVYWMRGA